MNALLVTLSTAAALLASAPDIQSGQFHHPYSVTPTSSADGTNRTPADDAIAQDSCRDIDVKLAALNALTQLDESQSMPMLKKLFARRDACSTPLRRRAIQSRIIPRGGSDESIDFLISIASTDPDSEVRSGAIAYLRGNPSEKVVQGLYKALTSFEDSRTQTEALGALAQVRGFGARKAIKMFIEAESTPEELKQEGVRYLSGAYDHPICSLGQTRSPEATATCEAGWREAAQYLREVYPKLQSESLKQSVIHAVAAKGGTENALWVLGLASDSKESVAVRRTALQSVTTMSPKLGGITNFERSGMQTGAAAVAVEDLVKAYDKMVDRQIKAHMLSVLSSRSEDAAFDKLGSIAKNDKDSSVRQTAVQYLSSSKDPRATRALAKVVNE
jgi:HEAT repeat protein